MKLKFSDMLSDLDRVRDEMESDNVDIGLVAHVGNTTEKLGSYFANSFDSKLIYLPSMNRKGKNQNLANRLNALYAHLPEFVLKPLSHLYRNLYRISEWEFPEDFDNEELTQYRGESSILVVDDNSYTGNTLGSWKQKISELMPNDVITFSVTVTGSYRPDYHCFEGWRSFEWRRIGI